MKISLARFTSGLLAFAISAIILTLIATRLSGTRLLDVLIGIEIRWFFLAVLANGFLFIPATMRWHMILRLAKASVDLGATLRSALAGHFFYVGLFGAVGGDSVRSYYYSRWHSRPFSTVLATAPLDRLLGFVGLTVFAACGVMLAKSFGGFESLRFVLPGRPALWLMALPIALILWFAGHHLLGRDFGRAFVTSSLDNARQLLRDPLASLAGVGCGALVQCSLAAVLVCNLQAATPERIPWAQLIWTFPLISIMGGLPISVAGLGTREAAAIGLLGLYGVASEAALVASLLSLASSLVWALVGGLAFWREEARHSRMPHNDYADRASDPINNEPVPRTQ